MGLDASVPGESEDIGTIGRGTQVSDDEVAKTLEANAAFAKQNVVRFCKLTDQLASEPIFKPLQGSRDATGELSRLFGVTNIEENQRITLPLAVRQSLMSGTGLELTAEQLNQIDFGWMRRMRDFDRLTGELEGPTNIGDMVYAPATKFPFYFMRLRLLRAAKIGDWEDAAKDIGAFATLLHTVNSERKERDASRAMELEVKTIAQLKESGVNVPDLGLPTAERVKLHGALAHDAFRFVAPGVDCGVQLQAFECAKRAGLECVMAFESVLMARGGLGRVSEARSPAFDRSRCNSYRFKTINDDFEVSDASSENARLRMPSPLFDELKAP